MTNNEVIEGIVRDVIREQFGDVRITGIEATPGRDEDDERVWYVKVIMEKSETKRIEAGKVSGIVRHLLPRMATVDDFGFPILSFIASSELGKRSPEAA